MSCAYICSISLIKLVPHMVFVSVPELWTYFFRVSSLAYPNLLGKKSYVVVVVVVSEGGTQLWSLNWFSFYIFLNSNFITKLHKALLKNVDPCEFLMFRVSLSTCLFLLLSFKMAKKPWTQILFMFPTQNLSINLRRHIHSWFMDVYIYICHKVGKPPSIWFLYALNSSPALSSLF